MAEDTTLGALQEKRTQLIIELVKAKKAVKDIETQIATHVSPFRVGQSFIYVDKSGVRHSGAITRVEYKLFPPYFAVYGALARKSGYRLARRIYRPDLLIINDVSSAETEDIIQERIKQLKRQKVIDPNS